MKGRKPTIMTYLVRKQFYFFGVLIKNVCGLIKAQKLTAQTSKPAMKYLQSTDNKSQK